MTAIAMDCIPRTIRHAFCAWGWFWQKRMRAECTHAWEAARGAADATAGCSRAPLCSRAQAFDVLSSMANIAGYRCGPVCASRGRAETLYSLYDRHMQRVAFCSID